MYINELDIAWQYRFGNCLSIQNCIVRIHVETTQLQRTVDIDTGAVHCRKQVAIALQRAAVELPRHRT